MKENYEILLDCSPFESFEKSREGLEQAIDRVEELLLEGTPSEQLQLIYVKQDASGEIVECEDVYEVKPLDVRGCDDMDESMDGDFDSAMTSAGLGTDEDYGCHGEREDCGWFGYEGLCED